jgi:multicomponent Na+:H+ antiporter subunit D
MQSETSILPLLSVLVSLMALVPIIRVGDKNPNLRESYSIVAGVAKFALVLSMLPQVLSGKTLYFRLFQILPGIEVAFRADALGILFAFGASLLWILTTFYSIGYMRGHGEINQTRYYACFAGALSSTMGVAFSANLFTMFLFYEALTIVTYPLVAHKDNDEARAGARKYVFYLLASAKLFLVAALVITYNLAGTLDFQLGGIFPEVVRQHHSHILNLVFLMYLYGFAKCALMPLHGWLPAAMVAPTPVSALLHAVAVVKTGVFTVLRIVFFVYGTDYLSELTASEFALYAACFTIVVASVIALTRDNIKARLAYSTVSQLSYIILGGLLLTASGAIGGIIHMSNHAFAKITLFFCAGSLYVSAHKTEVSQLDGIAKKMPLTMVAFTIGAMGMIGVPLVGGFVTKWYLLIGAMERESLLVIAVLLSSTLLNAGYFMPIIYRAFFKEYKGGQHGHGNHDHSGDIKENPFMVVPLLITALLSVIGGIYPDFVVAIAQEVFR